MVISAFCWLLTTLHAMFKVTQPPISLAPPISPARKIYGDLVLRFGLPSQILHDQGREFENHMFAKLERLSGMQKLRTIPYHPQCKAKLK